MNSFQQTIQQVTSHCETVTRKTQRTNPKAIKDLSRNLAVALTESGHTVEEYLQAYSDDAILDPQLCFQAEVDWHDWVNPLWKQFCDIMFELRPIGLGTPNAMVGEGEFMLCFGSPQVTLVKLKDQGDIAVGDTRVELKGAEMRIMGQIKGVEVQTLARSCAEQWDFQPNAVQRGRQAVEPWGLGKKQLHWATQFQGRVLSDCTTFLSQICSSFMSCAPKDFEPCFETGEWNPHVLRQIMVKGLWKGMTRKWDVYTVITANRVTALTPDEAQFNALVDKQLVKVTSDYFRSFQTKPVGLYVQIKGEVT